MLCNRKFQTNDPFCKSIEVRYTLENGKYNEIEIKAYMGGNWQKIYTIGSPIIGVKTIDISLNSARFEVIRLANDLNDPSFLKSKGKWISLTEDSSVKEEQHKEVPENVPSLPQIQSLPVKQSIKTSGEINDSKMGNVVQKKTNVKLPEIVKSKGIEFNGKTLTLNSPFHEVAQYLAEEYLLKPYPEEKSYRNINRYHHGVTHAACATYSVDNVLTTSFVNLQKKSYQGGLFIEILKKYLPTEYWDLINHLNNGKPLTEEEFLLTKYAVFCHDIGNTKEHFKDEKAHAAIFTHEMLRLGFSPEKTKIFANAIINKDAKGNKNIFEMLIHDADCWEFHRVLDSVEQFNIEELDVVKLLRKKLSGKSTLLKTALDEIKMMSEFYFFLMNYIYKSDDVHHYCEFSKNAYSDIVKLMLALRLSYQQNFKVDVENVIAAIKVTDYLAPLEFYNPQSIDKSKNLIDLLFGSIDMNEKKDSTLTLYQTSGVYIRQLQNFDNELATLINNKNILKKNNIQSEKQLKTYFVNDKKSGEAKLLDGFLFRPATLIKKGLAIHHYNHSDIGILIHPKASSVNAICFYKDNVYSNSICSTFLFSRPENVKNVETDTKLHDKLVERESRRRGETWDNYNRLFGCLATSHNEILLDYDVEAIVGIVVKENALSAENALNVRSKLKQLTGKNIQFYFYDYAVGLQPVTDADVLSMSSLKPSEDSSFMFNRKTLDACLAANNIIYPDYQSVYCRDFHPDLLENIECSLFTNEPSTQHPITFNFSNADNTIKGKGYYKNGFPIIEINGTPFYDVYSYLTVIAHKHQMKLVDECNALFSKLNFAPLGIQNIKLTLQQTNKFFLYLDYKQTAKESKPADILNYIGYDTTKLKSKLIEQIDSSQIRIKLPVIQALSAIKRKLIQNTNGKKVILKPLEDKRVYPNAQIRKYRR